MKRRAKSSQAAGDTRTQANAHVKFDRFRAIPGDGLGRQVNPNPDVASVRSNLYIEAQYFSHQLSH